MSAPQLPLAELEKAYRRILTIRLFEDRARREFGKGDMPGFVHSYAGAEAIATGVCAHLGNADMITSTHRGHGHCLAKGVDIMPMVAELYGRANGLCKGRGGSMHIADYSKGMLGANAIVAGGVGLAVGAALAARTLGDGRVSATFFGDGATSQGVLHESMNLASIWRLPVIFVCENNGWAESTPAAYAVSVPKVSVRAAGYSMPGTTVDASDYEAVHEAARVAVERARQGDGPSFIEATYLRIGGHYAGDSESYRSRDDRRAARDGDVVTRTAALLADRGSDPEGITTEVEHDVVARLDEAFAAARASDWPDAEGADRYVYSH